MSNLSYLARVLNGLPPYDSAELISAKEYRSQAHAYDFGPGYDLYRKEIDPFMFGAVGAVSDEHDNLSSRQLEERAGEIYRLCNK